MGDTPVASVRERVSALTSKLLSHDTWSRDQLMEHQQTRLHSMIEFAVANSPYYRETLDPDAARGDVPLDELPTLSKTTLMAEWDRIVTDPALRLDDVEAHIAGPAAARPFAGRYMVFSTAGTTGVRGIFVYEMNEFLQIIAPILRTFARWGLVPGSRVVGVGAPNPLHLSKQLFAALQTGPSDAPQLSVMTPMPEIVAALNDFQPEATLGYPTHVSLLAEQQLAGHLRIAPRFMAVGSEVVGEDVVRRAEAAWGIRLCNVYATTETSTIASSSPDEAALLVNDDLLVFEVVDEANRPVPPSEPGYKVLVTSLTNRSQPLIRYEISDSVTLAEGDFDASPYKRIARIDGRSDDVLYLPGVSGGEIALHPYRIRAPFGHIADVLQYQVVHSAGGLRARVVLRPSAPRTVLDRIHAAITGELADAGVGPMQVDIEPVPEIERQGNGAKIKMVVSTIEGRAAAPLIYGSLNR